MKLLNVYPLYDLEPVRAEECYLWDKEGTRYLDLYGGHAVISIGHSHPHFVRRISDQLQKMGFYSNSVQNPLQVELAAKLGKLSGLENFRLFLINSGAEAMENALKVAAFHNKRSKIVALKGAFHGRTSAAVAITDNPKIQSTLNPASHVVHIHMDDLEALEREMRTGEVCAVVAEGVQGVAGAYVPSDNFWREARRLCDLHGTVLIADEIQSGYARSGHFFAYQSSGIEPDLVTIAKGMGNGFPVGGVLVHPKFDAWYGMLGTTFGGNHLAMAACLAVLEVIEEEGLQEKASELGTYFREQLRGLSFIEEIRGKGLMIGMELDRPAKEVRRELLMEHQVFTGSAAQPHTLRILPPLSIKKEQIDVCIDALKVVCEREPAAL